MDGVLPILARQPNPTAQQQRPSLLYFIFLAVLFFLVSNNNPQPNINSPTLLSKLQENLDVQILKSEGLRDWLGVGNGSNATEYKLETVDNSKIVEELQMLKLIERDRLFEQNLTGFVKGNYTTGLWDLQNLGLEELYNITSFRPETTAEMNNRLGLNESTSLNNTVPLLNTTLTPLLINTTITHNRTLARQSFPFSPEGKVTFNLRSEQTSATGPVLPLKKMKNGRIREGDLIELRKPNATWEEVGGVVYLRGDVTLMAQNGEEYQLDVEAVHFLEAGTVYGYLTPPSISSHLLLLPSLANFDNSTNPAEMYSRNSTATAIGFNVLKELSRRIENETKELESVRGGTSRNGNNDDSVQGPECIFTLYAHLTPFPTAYTRPIYSNYINSLSHPSTSIAPPPSTLTYTLHSTNCALLLTGQGTLISSLQLWSRVTRFAYLMGLVQVVLLWKMIQQIESSLGGGGNGRLSWLMIGLQVGLDGYFFIICFTVGLVTNNRASLPLLVPAFFSMLSSLLFGMRWAATIRAAIPPAPSAPPAPTLAEITVRAAERRAAIENQTEIPILLQLTSFSGRVGDDLSYVALGIGIAIFSLSIIFKYGWLALSIIVLHSYWLPQIVHNIYRSSSRLSLSLSYILYITTLRLLLPFYLYACPANILSVTNSNWIYSLIVYNYFLAFMLWSQERYGTRWFLPQRALNYLEIDQELIWNYFPSKIGIEGEEEESLIGGSDERMEDCPICMESIELNVDLDKKEKNEKEDLKRFSFMVPPCGHVAHTACLENWMEIKSICPVCRRVLPPM